MPANSVGIRKTAAVAPQLWRAPTSGRHCRTQQLQNRGPGYGETVQKLQNRRCAQCLGDRGS